MNSPICYLRAGRSKRATGIVCGANSVGVLVKPANPKWKRVVVTHAEIAAGKEKAPYKPRERREGQPAPTRQPRTPKPPPAPRWKQLVARVRIYEIDHAPQSWPAVEMSLLTALVDELEQARLEVASFLPLTSSHANP